VRCPLANTGGFREKSTSGFCCTAYRTPREETRREPQIKTYRQVRLVRAPDCTAQGDLPALRSVPCRAGPRSTGQEAGGRMSRPAKPDLLAELRQSLADAKAELDRNPAFEVTRRTLRRRINFLEWEIDALTSRTPFADFSNTQPPTPHRGGEPL